MFLAALLLASAAQAAPEPERLTWSLNLNGKAVGERTLTVSTEQTPHGELRTLRADTRVDAKAIGVSLAYRQKLTAHATTGPASFISVVERQGELSEIQGRPVGTGGWFLSIAGDGRQRSYDLPASEVDLSTADLLDPGSRDALSRYTDLRVLVAETGAIVAGTVASLGASTVTIQGEPVQVEGYRIDLESWGGTFYYTADGWLVRFETRVFGQRIDGELTAPPPRGVDDAPVDVFGPGLRGSEL